MKVVTDSMETAASATDLSTARQGLIHSMERLRESLAAPAPANGSDTGKTRNISTVRVKGLDTPSQEPPN